jgi:hypothetical protein
MPPTPTPTEPQIDKVREIAGENRYATISNLIDNLTDGQWARALELITAWDTEYAAGESIGLQGEGVVLDPHVDAGLDIRSRMRLLLGLPELRSSSITGESGSAVLRNQFVF